MATVRPSAFVQRCLEALKEYERLKFLGVSHEMASRPLREALQGKDVRTERDPNA